MYEYLLKLIKDNNAEISVCGYKKVYSEEIEYISYGNDTVLDTIEGLKTLLYNNDVGNYVWNKLFLTSSFKENFYFLMRAFIDMNPETIKHIDDNLLFDKLINSGKER